MYRALIKIVVALALATGLTYATGGASNAAPAAAESSVAPRAASCSAEQKKLGNARAVYANWVKVTKKSRASYKKAQRVEKKTVGKKAKKRAHAKTVKARNKYVSNAKRSDVAKKRAVAARRAYDKCVAANQPQPAPAPSASPIQVLCDAGIPQVVCDQLVVVIPGGDATSTIKQFCTAFPQGAQLCTLLDNNSTLDPALLVTTLNQIINLLPEPSSGLLQPVFDLLKLNGLGGSVSANQLNALLSQLGITPSIG